MSYDSVDDKIKPIITYHQKSLVGATSVIYNITAPSGALIVLTATVLDETIGTTVHTPVDGVITETGVYTIKSVISFGDGRVRNSTPQIFRIT